MSTFKTSVAVTAIALAIAAIGATQAQGVTIPRTTLGGAVSSAGLRDDAISNGIYVDRGSGVISAVRQSGGITRTAHLQSMGAVQAQAQTVVKIEYRPGPALTSPDCPAFLTALLNGTASGVSTLRAEDIIASATELTRGYTYYRIEITDPLGIVLRDYIVDQDSNDQFNGALQHSLKLTQDMLGFDYDQWRPGYKADGTKITAGSNTQVANKIVIIGICISFTGNTPADYDNAVRYIGMQNPIFAVSTSVKTRGTTGSPTTIALQPWSMSASGMIPPSTSLAMAIRGVVTVKGLNASMSHTVYVASAVTGPWTPYKTVYSADGTYTFPVSTTFLGAFFH